MRKSDEHGQQKGLREANRSDRDLTPQVTPRMRDRLVRLAYRYLWNFDDAEDVAQEALCRAHREGDTLREPDKWWSWTCRILIRACHDHGRRKRRRQDHEAALATDVRRRSDETFASPFSDEARRMRWCVQQLPPRQRDVIVLRHLEGQSFEQIADVLGMAESTARVHARAGREALRALWMKNDAM